MIYEAKFRLERLFAGEWLLVKLYKYHDKAMAAAGRRYRASGDEHRVVDARDGATWHCTTGWATPA